MLKKWLDDTLLPNCFGTWGLGRSKRWLKARSASPLKSESSPTRVVGSFTSASHSTVHIGLTSRIQKSFTMDPEDITYSREATIAAVSDYYTFLTRMHMHESHVVYPPPGGWPEIVDADPAVLQSFGKSDEVLALLAHLPYVRSSPYVLSSWEIPEVAPGCTVADWPHLITLLSSTQQEDAYSLRLHTEGTFHSFSPPHVVGLIDSQDQAMVLDTKHGIIHWEDCPGRINYGGHCKINVDWADLDDGVPQEEADWRYGAIAWTISDFFEVLKDQFVQLDWLPIGHFTLRAPADGEYPGEEGMMVMLQDFYRQHGWPDLAAYRKTDCLKAVKKAMAERYPESVCYRTEDED
ncbi:hypothetical protein B0I37DRAFT_373202 [Chaetomium sp. MPI-CAGE-AT-0009]|nr:hypothetical protein B0I37DRAFT_373202 [Chaetomium sp. MPI-CAGE-AT-0009]